MNNLQYCISRYLGDRQRFLSCLLTLKTEIDHETLCPLSKLAPAALAWLQEVADIDSAKSIGKFI